MSSLISSSVFKARYRDDFRDSDGYYRILFNSGRSLQARELTQMQTIIQEQIKRFGNNQFKEGAAVNPTEKILNNAYEFVKLNTSSLTLPANTTPLIGTTFTGSSSTVTAKVIEILPAADGDPATMYVAYTNSPAGQAGAVAVRFSPGEQITNGVNTLAVQTTNTDTDKAVGRGTRYSVGEGIYYTQGFFVFTESQSTIVSKYRDDPTEVIGYRIVEETVDVDDDRRLYDNQGLLLNTSAPGADRYKITLSLTTESKVLANQNFIPIATLINGVVFRAVDENNSFNVINDVISTRIKENSGDYIIKPFRMSVETDSEDTHLLVNISDGIAVVDGYRSNHYAPETIRVKKPVNTATIENEATATDYGNYVLVDNATQNNKGLPNINTFELMNLRNDSSYGGSTIGSARVRSVSEDVGDKYKFFLFNIEMNAGENFRRVKSVGTSGTNYFNPERINGQTVLYGVKNNRALFLLPNRRPQSLADIVLTTQRSFAQTSTSGGSITISLSGSGETFANSGDWIVSSATGQIVNNFTFGSTPDGQISATINSLPVSTSIEVLAYVRKSTGTVRSKTLTQTTVTKAVNADGDIELGKADIYDIQQIKLGSASGADISKKFTLDNGQRDNHYDLGKLVLNPGVKPPTGNVYVQFKYFQHGANGDFFAVSSYTGQVDYNKIYNHRLANGFNVNLREVLDFRSVKDTNGAFASTVNGARVNELPQLNDIVSSDNTYYLQRKFTLFLNREGQIELINSTEDFNPKNPERPVGMLPLYNVLLRPNTLNDSDIATTKIEHRRYTMADITELDRRIDDLEEITSLNLLEVDTKNFQVLDSNGLDRTKSGFIVDNFATQAFSATRDQDYRASIDPSMKMLLPSFNEDNIRLIYDSDLSTNVIKKGDNVYLNHDSKEFLSQTSATQSTSLNKFDAVIYKGDITISPASDEWREVKIRAKKTIDGGSKLDTKQAYLWNNWQWNWGGIKVDDLKVGNNTNTKKETSATQIKSYTNKVVSEETLVELIGEKVVNIALIPFMRSKKVFFKAEGLRPNSKVWAYFDGTRVDDWVREEPFQRFAANAQDFGNKHNNATAHPSGSGVLTSDANGSVTGSFFIPNTNAIRFRTGVREFKILDISVNNESKSTTNASTLYISTGYLDTIDQTFKSTRILNIEAQVSTQKIVKQSSGGGGGGGDGGHGRVGHKRTRSGIGVVPHAAGETGPSAKIICTAMNQDYGFGSYRNAVWLKYSEIEYVNKPEYEIGYHAIFKPLLKIRHKNAFGKTTYKLLQHIAKHRTADLRAEMHGRKRDTIGRAWRFVLEPLCYMTGKVILKVKGQK